MVLAVDVGKTNLRLAVVEATGAVEVRTERRTSAAEVGAGLEAMVRAAEEMCREWPVRAVGLSIFGPLESARATAAFGAIGESSEAAWSGVNVPRLLWERLGLPVWFDYDVNAGALAEARLGAGRGAERFLYLSVGTGIGGALWDGGLRWGSSAQMGHIFVGREAADGFAGCCRMHGDCLQGLAGGKAMGQRWGVPAEELPAGHAGWEMEARYLARAAMNFVYTLGVERVVLGSSVVGMPGLAERADVCLKELLKGFVEPAVWERMLAEAVVQRAGLLPDSSLLGAALLAREELGVRFGG